MSDGSISIDVELNEKEFQASLNNMGEIVRSGSETMIKSIDNLGENFALLPSNIDTVFKSVPTLISGLLANIESKNPEMAKTGSDFFNALVANIPEVAENIAEKIPAINNGIINKFISFIPEIGNAGYNLFSSLTDNLPEAIEAINEEVPNITSQISDKLDEQKEFIANTGFNLFTSLNDNLPNAIEIIAQAPEQIVDNVITGFTSLLFKFNDIGVNMVQGVWAGISSMAAWLVSQVKGFFDGIIGGVMDFLGINSPSLLFKDKIGRNIALGIGEGISAEMPEVASDMLKYMNKVVENAEKSAGRIDINKFVNSTFDSGYKNNIKSMDFKADTGSFSDMPSINITLEPSGDIRGFFEYISMNIKRVDYLSGGADI